MSHAGRTSTSGRPARWPEDWRIDPGPDVSSSEPASYLTPAPPVIARPRAAIWRRRLAAGLAVMLAALVYYAGARLHAGRMNTIKRDGDQSAYVQYVKDLYDNWHGHVPPHVGDRNRMPLYPAYQALFYDPQLSDEAFFRVARVRSIELSLALLGVVGLIAARHLPALVAVNFTAIVAFGLYIFKAGYVQAELLFYTLLFATVVGACHLLAAASVRRRFLLAALVGVIAALAHLTKAAALPLVALLAGVLLVQAARLAVRAIHQRQPEAGRQALLIAGAVLLMACTFLAVLSPYLATSQRVFGRYFYNVNTTFYIWYDNLGQAMEGTRAHGDRVGWPKMPRRALPGPLKYWRQHAIGQILERLRGGFRQMGIDLWSGYWVAKYLVLYLLLAIVLAVAQPALTRRLARAHAAPVAFLGLYLALYFVATAFYAPISGTGTARFMLAHVPPLFFILSWWFAHPDVRALRWRIGGIELRPAHFHVLVLCMLLVDLPFAVWPRLTSTYGGF